MDNLLLALSTGEPAVFALLAWGALGIGMSLLMAGASVARWRVPAALWIAPPVVAVLLGAIAAYNRATKALTSLTDVDAIQVVNTAALHEASIRSELALGLWIGATQATLAMIFLTVGVAARPRRPVTSWLNGAMPLVMGTIGVTIASAVHLFFGGGMGTVATVLLGALVGVACMSVLSARQSNDPTTQHRLAASRVLVLCLAVVGVVLLAFGLTELSLAAALNPMGDGPSLAHRLTDAIAGTKAAPLALAVMVLALFGGGLSGLSTARSVMGSFRGAASGVAALVVLAVLPMSLALAYSAIAPVRTLARGGAVSELSMGLFHKLPQTEDFAGGAVEGKQIQGTCLVSEAPAGWSAGPLYGTHSPAAHVAGAIINVDATHELDRAAGCPEVAGPKDGPFAFSEVPIVAMDASRAGAALTGEQWFRERGALRLLVQPDPLQTLSEPDGARLQASTVSFVWEQPPALPPAEAPTPGVWNEEVARTLPVTLMEGPYPVLVAGGLHTRLAAGELGRDTLRLALTMRDPSDRTLVLIPRKTWTVQDLVGFCLAVQEVPSAQCVVRPENPIYWTIRTGLPLPW